jgi:tetratricopeptide (TPR) repeat protein
MGRSKSKRKQTAAAKKTAPAPAVENPRRRWLFRLAAMLIVPCLFLAAIEIGLRWASYGYPTAFFQKAVIGGKEVLIENRRFGLRFFEPGAERTPDPIVLSPEKAPGTTRIFLFGESAALGDPYPAYGMGRYLQVLLRDRWPERKFEVVCVAMTAINSHVIVPIARECAKYQGDLWIVYMGNNEMIGPGGGARSGKLLVPSARLLRMSYFLKTFRVGQWIDSTMHRFKKRDKPQGWQGLAEYLDRKIAPDDPARARVDENFRSNLEKILETAEHTKAKVLLCPVSGNLADWSPHVSFHQNGMAQESMTEWEKNYHAGENAWSNGQLSEALENFGRAEVIDPGFAEAHYRAGLCQVQLSNFTSARKEFQLALDCDGMPVRTTSARNEIIRAVGRAHSQTTVVEMDDDLAGRCSAKSPGREVFLDHVHFNFNGNYLAARALADGVEKSLVSTASNLRPWLTQEKCEADLGMTDWNRNMVHYLMLRRLAEPFYTNQWTNAKSRREISEQMAAYQRNLKTNPPSDSLYLEALKKWPGDHYIMENYAWFLEWKDDFAAATREWKEVTALLPYHPVAYFNAGRMALKAGKFEDAEENLRQALKIRPEFTEAQVELGRVYRFTGKTDLALKTIRAAVAQSPLDPVGHFELGDALAAANQKSEAASELQESIRLFPEYWKPRFSLGLELAVQEKNLEAARQFQEVARLNPEFAPAHLNLGVALAKQNKIREAMGEFQRTVELDPTNRSAREMLDIAKGLLKSRP